MSNARPDPECYESVAFPASFVRIRMGNYAFYPDFLDLFSWKNISCKPHLFLQDHTNSLLLSIRKLEYSPCRFAFSVTICWFGFTNRTGKSLLSVPASFSISRILETVQLLGRKRFPGKPLFCLSRIFCWRAKDIRQPLAVLLHLQPVRHRADSKHAESIARVRARLA